MTNQEIAKLFREMAMLFEMEGVAFKPRAYEKAAQSIESLDTQVADLYKQKGKDAFAGIPGVGKGIGDHLTELMETGHFKEYERLKKKIPVDIAGLAAIEGIGPKMIKTLWEELKVRTVADLQKAARAGKIRTLPHFGAKSEQSILKAIGFLNQTGGRRLLGSIRREARALEETVRSFPETGNVVIAGSFRRRKETIGDIDILVVSKNPRAVMDRFVKLPVIRHVYGHGPTKTNVRLANGLDADLRAVPDKSFGAALNYFTGSKEHNVALREIAIKKGWKLNEYGLFRADTRGQGPRPTQKKEMMIAGRTEEEIYNKLGLRYIEPEMRENTGEIAAAALRSRLSLERGQSFQTKSGMRRGLPNLIGYGDLKGDLQIQTSWTDGKNSIEEMAHAAAKAGLEYIAITDHTQYLSVTRGLDEKKIIRQMAEIDRINGKLRKQGIKFRILKGTECDIHKDGSLDLSDAVLAKLDVVGISVHSYFKLPREEQTRRVIRAMENPHADIVFHLTGRLINKRAPIDIDIDAIIATAKRTGTIMEINASPDRLDLKDEYIRKCIDAGVAMCIDSDAHAIVGLSFLEYGIAQARRGWAEKKNIINTLPVNEFLQRLKKQ
ncbi:MAG: DNA polymerase/3'-5' exonuclease PolX [Candidatus Sungbacteria bacterium]|nr:DNA polymerase/3'-5' exonuclease PolX [Candidatus Sungbacteria bacterium]